MKKGPALRIDPEFRRLVAPIQEADRLKQEKWITRRGHSLPIRVWRDTILVDYDTYSFCSSHNIPSYISNLHIKNREEAVIWICRNQLDRKDLAEEMTRYLIGRYFLAMKAIRTKNALDDKQEGQKSGKKASVSIIYEQIGRLYNVSPGTVKKYSIYALALDHLYAIEPVFVQQILQGVIHLSHENLVVIREMKRVEVAAVARYFLDEKVKTPTFSKYMAIKAAKKEERPKSTILAGTIKEMPEYDPDAAVASLALTIPSWVGSIQRAEKNTDFAQISEKARNGLMHELYALIYAIESILSQLEENLHG